MAFIQKNADVACNFFEKILKHSADEWYGQAFLLAPWQEEALVALFGNIDDDGRRLIEMAYLEVPKKAGKSEWAAGIILLALLMDPNPGCQIYGAASATRQAVNVYRAACKMVEQSSLLKQNLRVLRGTNRIVKRNDPDSFYGAIAADGDLGDGVNPSVVVADELHRWKTRKQLDNWDVLTNGGITRRQTMTIAITTAGIQSESPLAWRLHEKTRKINAGVLSDPKFYGRIYGASDQDDPEDPETWIKANPSLKQRGGFLDIEKIREKFVSLQAEGDLTSFKRYFLNLWDQKESRAIDMKQWHACHRDWDAHGWPLPHELEARFMDRRCWIGVDVSMTTDLSAVVAVFERPDGRYDLLCSCWLPQNGVRKRELQDGMPYSKWIREGYVEVCDGNMIDLRMIRARIGYLVEMFDVQAICFDPFNTREMSGDMKDDGLPCFEVRQNAPQLNEATKKVLGLIATGNLVHGGHPVLAHHASCLCTKSDGNDLIKPIKPDREKESSRIDLIAAMIDAFAKEVLESPQDDSYTIIRSIG